MDPVLAFWIYLGGVSELFHQLFSIVKIDRIREERFRGVPLRYFSQIAVADMAPSTITDNKGALRT